ncbi:ATP-binding protein [Streptomyces griseoloalbus]|uniref:DNA-binding CsgD family transcriptional regulator n=1 Tax=Streptomyces griseoloalbus TaxID=67303 RepID=A0A7W8FC73_9ACTN|nr:LuxR family transcriptional regulator [Streptomyces albaduncus]MBB5128176.1 DNA-binding CsgD family transcriptional regulator [Streptomyces albaduncus]
MASLLVAASRGSEGTYVLYGRSTELAALEDLIATARRGHSGALVLRGEAGIGKTALLDCAVEVASASGVRVLRVTGIEPEADLAFGGLVQLLWPVQDRLDALPELQADALRSVLGISRTRTQDRFLTGLAVLTLLADLAEQGPVLCLVDDAQWLDQATAEALLFAARRLAAEQVAMVFATRAEGFAAPGLTELRPSRLGTGDAARLLAHLGLPPALRDQVIAESAGNPLALIEFGAARRDDPSKFTPVTVADRVLSSYRAQIGALPEKTRLALLVAAAEGRGDLPLQMKAGRMLDLGLEDLEDAERVGLIQVTESTVAFRHPLIGTAAYQGAVLARRIAVHQALADAAEDPDCRARHLPLATMSPDDAVAAELVAAADRAADRSAYAAAALLHQQAARLTSDHRAQTRRLGDAAALALNAGHTGQAADLAEQAERSTDEPKDLAWLAPVRAAVMFELGDQLEAARLLLERASSADPEPSRDMLRTGATYAWFAGDADLVRETACRLQGLGEADPMVEGMAHLADEDYACGIPLLERASTAGPADGDMARARALHSAILVGDDVTAMKLAAAEVARCRAQGLIGALPQALHLLAERQVQAGAHRDAEASVAEAVEIARDTGLRQRVAWLNGVPARIAAIEGDELRCRSLAEDAPDVGKVASESALSLLELAQGDYEAALSRLEAAIGPGPQRHMAMTMAAVADQVEAAARLGDRKRAKGPMRAFDAWAQASSQPWTRAVAHRCRALIGGQEEDYAEAIHLHEQGGRPFERARTELLYGEWLRRARRRSDARAVLRSALGIFEQLRAAPWAERVRAELRAAGDTTTTAKATAKNVLDRLTPQELQVVRLAADGNSSREIAAQLFLSRRTVEHHLYKAYPKLGVGSRRELARLKLT